MNKSLVSDSNIWIDIAGAWSRCSKEPSENFSEGLRAVDTINNILGNAPSDVGGTINLGVTINEVNELLIKWDQVQNFTNSIHYEIAEIVDLPYTKKANQVMEDVYNLSPQDFRTEENILIWERGESLEELLVKIITDSTAKASYEALVNLLDNDIPDAKFEEIMKDTHYWLVEFEKNHKIREYAAEFIKKHQSKWDSYSHKEKIKLLNDYAVEIGKCMDNEKWYDFFTGHKIVTSVEYATSDPHYDPTSTAYGYTYAQSKDGKIYISDKYGNSSDPLYNLPSVVTTVTHEARHQYQGQAYDDPKRYNLPNYEQTEWFDRINHPGYWLRPWEIDARAYSGLSN
ncbi:hypothetical protein [Anaerosporobacter sp.]